MTMYSHLSKRVRAIPSSSGFYSSPPRYQNLPLLTPLLFSSLSTQIQTQNQHQKELPFIAQYLISSFGFSPHRALKCSADSHLAPIKSPARPEAVVKFLSDTGLTDAQIKAAISLHPNILGYNVDHTLKPKACELINGGCSPELLVQLIRYNPKVLQLNGNLRRLHFWRDFVGKDDQVLCRLIERSTSLLTYSIDRRILPIINLLKEYGMSNSDIVLLLRQKVKYMTKSLNSLRKLLELIEELGIPRGSKLFLSTARVICASREDTVKNNMKLFNKTYGWSQEDLSSAFRKFPNVLTLSENKVKSNMDFLLGKALFEPRSVAFYPVLIGLSLERVLIPRHTVLCELKAKGLKIKCSLATACKMSERRFREKYVVPFEKDFPELGPAYAASLVRKFA